MSRRRAALAAAGAAYGLTLVTAFVFWARDTVPPRWDAAGHLLHSLEYRDLLLAGDLRQFLWTRYAYYPPLVYQVTGALHALLGPEHFVASIVMLAFALALAVATYRLGRVVGGEPVGGLAAACVLLLPIVTVFTREFALDVPLMAASTAFLALALERPLQSWRRAAALGAAMGLGLITKWAFALAAAGPLAYLVVTALRERDSRRALKHLGLALLVALVLAGPWYFAHLGRLWEDARLNAVAVAAREGDPAPGSVAALLYYARMAVNEWFSLPLAALVVWALAAAIRGRGRTLLLLNVAVWPVYVLFTAIPNKDPRYGLPMVPVLCVALAQAILGLGSGMWRRLWSGLAVGLLVLQHVAGVVDLGPLSARVNVCAPGASLSLYDPADPPAYFHFRGKVGRRRGCSSEWTLYNPFSYFGRRPRTEDWRIDRIVEAVATGEAVRPPPADDVHLNPLLLEYVARRMGRPLLWVGTPEESTVTVSRGGGTAAGNDCQGFDQPDGTRVTVCRRVR